MKLSFKKLFLLAILGLLGLVAYDYIRLGYHTLPDMPAGAWPISFKNGTRAIMVDIPDESLERRYIATPAADVPTWFKDAWSFCRIPSDEEEKQIFPPDRGMRLDALCSIDVDGEIIHTAVIYSVPKL